MSIKEWVLTGIEFVFNIYGFVLIVFFTGTLALFADSERPEFDQVIDSKIHSASIQSDGNFLVAGSFSEGYLFRISPERKIDWSFMQRNEIGGFNREVRKVKVTESQNIIAVGDFTAYDQNIVGGIVQLEPDGSIDYNFALKSGVGFDDRATDFVLLPKGKILVTGDFTSYNGESSPYLAILNPDGSLFKSSKELDINGPVKKLKLAKDSESAYILGDFSEPRRGFLKLALSK